MADDTYLYSGEVKAKRYVKSHRRTYVYNCPVCGKWRPCATITVQVECCRAGCCVPCQADPQWRTRVLLKVIQLHLDALVQRAKTVPEEERTIYRVLYKKRLRQAAIAKMQIEPAEVPA